MVGSHKPTTKLVFVFLFVNIFICLCAIIGLADGLTELECAVPQRSLLLFHTVQDPVSDDYDSDLEEEEEGVVSYSSDHSFPEYSVSFGF